MADLKFYFLWSCFFLIFTSGKAQPLKLGLPAGHTQEVSSADFSSDGKYLATASRDFTAKIWDSETGSLLYTLKGHNSPVNFIQFSSDGEQVVTAAGNYNENVIVKVWDVKTGKLIHNTTLKKSGTYPEIIPDIEYIGFLDNSNSIMTLHMGEVNLFNIETGDLVTSFGSEVHKAAISPQGDKLLTTNTFHISGDSTISPAVWDIESGEQLFSFQMSVPRNVVRDNPIEELGFSADGNIVYISSFYNTKTWDVQTGEVIGSWQFIDAVSPNGELIVTGSLDGNIKLLKNDSGRQVDTLIGNKGYVRDAHFSPNNRYLIISASDDTARTWNIETGKLTNTFYHDINYKNQTIFSPDAKRVLMSNGDLRDVENGEFISSILSELSTIRLIDFSPDGNYLVTGLADSTAIIWNIKTGELIQTFKGHQSAIHTVEFSPDGSQILTSSFIGNAPRLWDTKTGNLIKELRENKIFYKNSTFTNGASFSRDGRLILTYLSTRPGTTRIRLWDVRTGFPVQTWHEGSLFNDGPGSISKKIWAVAVSPDGRKVAVVGDSTIRILGGRPAESSYIIDSSDVQFSSRIPLSFSPDGKFLASASSESVIKLWKSDERDPFFTIKGPEDGVQSLSFSEDSKLLATTSNDNSVKIWNVPSGNLLKTLKGHKSSVHAIEFSSNNRYLATSSEDQTIRIWNVETGRTVLIISRNQIVSGYLYTDEKSFQFSPDGSKLAVAYPSNFTIWDIDSGKKLIQHFTFNKNPNQWVRLSEGVRYDATPGAIQHLYWTKGTKVVEFHELKDRYYKPGLWEKLMGKSGE